MPAWSYFLNEADKSPDPINYLTSQKQFYLNAISEKTGRNTIAYYSGWLKGLNNENVSINDSDKNAFMEMVYNLKSTGKKGLDLILHTPGGDIAAAESIIDYLHSVFNGDIRAIIPQMSMSAGTMIALSCKEIMMGKQSNLGPIDPQMGGIACNAVLSEFKKAKEEVSRDISCLGLWQVILSKYNPTFLIACENAVNWSKEIAEKWVNCANIDKKQDVIKLFTSHEDSKVHNRHFPKQKCKDIGLKIIDMEDDNYLQDLILSLHHCYLIFLEKTIVAKILENQINGAYLKLYQTNPNPQTSPDK